MAKQLDQVVVVDVEATCWEGAPRPGQTSEIIEIGVCLLDPATGERSDKDGLLVKPVTSTVSAFCTELTTLTQAQVDGGVPFMDACNWLKKRYMTKERTWASWGTYDRRQFQRQCRAMGVPDPFGPDHINAKNLYALMTGARREVGMARALEDLGLPLEGVHHRGIDDAWNIAAVLAQLLKRRP